MAQRKRVLLFLEYRISGEKATRDQKSREDSGNGNDLYDPEDSATGQMRLGSQHAAQTATAAAYSAAAVTNTANREWY